MAHHAPKWFADKVKRDIGVSVVAGLIGGSFFRYWHKAIYVPTVQDYYQKYEDATLQRLEAKALEQAAWESQELPVIRERLNRIFEALWTSESVDDLVAGTLTSGDDEE
ncbi:MAG: hypothetical protein Q8P67_29235 [archaeon]|nr:hypothetical protein [archaeon]